MNTNNIIWLCVGIIIGSSFMIGTQFAKEIVIRLWRERRNLTAENLRRYINSTLSWEEVVSIQGVKQ